MGHPAGCAGGPKNRICSTRSFAEYRAEYSGTNLAARAERRNTGTPAQTASGRKSCTQPDARLFGGAVDRLKK